MRESVVRETVGGGENSRASTGKRSEFIQNLDRVTTSFFITNFPENASAKILRELFQKYGGVAKVYIPKKFDKRGCRFGFVKFKEVIEVEALTENLKDVWLGSFKLRVNRARFGRSERKEELQPKASRKKQAVNVKVIIPGKSFKSALLGGCVDDCILKEALSFKATVNEAFLKELKGSVVGTLACERDVRRLRTIFYTEGYQSIRVTHMGGNMVLLCSSVEGDISKLMRRNSECLEFFFSEVKPWEPGLVAKQRETWVQVVGIPLHIWGEDFFKLVGAKLGEFLDFDEETVNMASFDIARLKIRTKTLTSIDSEFNVEVEGMVFQIGVMEERRNYSPGRALGEEVNEGGSRVVPSEYSGA
ncbi:hypothetical protein TSUD_355220 [Trifolium subterraneum]|uniref:RRM domain-containing protein n=1 Tax=Trifolium subterraneum TaxID=3900 RepID=A0A2Z6MDK5_TRISU|nr:hypothetical protein TSUD_355220 [Trifolium subterraneum]